MKPEKKNIEEIMKNLSLPVIDVNQHQKEYRLTLLNTKKSAFLGVLLLILPFLFLSGVILKHYLKIDFGFLTSVYDWIGDIDHKYWGQLNFKLDNQNFTAFWTTRCCWS